MKSRPELRFQCKVVDEDLLVTVKNVGDNPTECRYSGRSEDSRDSIMIEIYDVQAGRLGPTWMCGTGVERGFLVLQPGDELSRIYHRFLISGDLKPGDNFTLGVKTTAGQAFSGPLAWPHWPKYEEWRLEKGRILRSLTGSGR